MGTHDFKYNNVPLFARNQRISILRVQNHNLNGLSYMHAHTYKNYHRAGRIVCRATAVYYVDEGNEAAQNVAAGIPDMEAEQSHTDKGIPRSYENITLCHLNVCGWTKSNEQLRIGITNEINPDIFSLNETHLGESQIINVEGYSWKGFNRTCVHKDAPKASRRALAS